jgi:hypothetical protein
MLLRRAALAEILPLRHVELRPGLLRATACFDGDDEPTTLHVGAFDQAAIVGCASWMLRSWQGEPGWQLRGMATRADRVRRGVGRAVLVAGERMLCDASEVRRAWCNARVAAIPFYERVGWQVASDVFDVPGVGPHRAMTRRL